MKKQPSLINNDRSIIAPASEQPEPIIYIREIILLKALKPGEENEIRRIKLRKGLNVLWAKPESSKEPPRLFEQGFSGHASGKTTFCRLIRYILGEKHFGNQQVVENIRLRFRSGWVVGEVFINGELWLVFRPFGVGSHPFVIKETSLNEFWQLNNSDRISFSVYIETLQQATVQKLSVKKFAYSNNQIDWLHLLQWLSRDQECRFSQLNNWRNSLSNSDSPELSSEDQYSLIRLVTGILDEQENYELENNARLLKDRDVAIKRIPILKSQASVDHNRLQQSLGEKLPSLDEPLFRNQVESKIKQNVLNVQKELKNFDSDIVLEVLEEKFRKQLKATAFAEAGLQQIDTLIEGKNTELELVKKNESKESIEKFILELKPGRGYCSVSMNEARSKSCPIAHETPADFQSEKIFKEIELRAAEIEKQIHNLQTNRYKQEHHIKELNTEELNLRKQILSHRTKKAEEGNKLINSLVNLEDQLRLSKRASESWNQAAKFQASIATFEDQIKESQNKQRNLRSKKQSTLNQISLIYNQIVCAVLGESVLGTIDSSGRQLIPRIEKNGDVSSGAIDTIKILAFDLSILTASISGQGFHPRFLIHDSPREADMASSTYQRFFLWVKNLEELMSDENCNFQYIITTTEPPPAELQKYPWLINPVLDSSKPENRLFGVDL